MNKITSRMVFETLQQLNELNEDEMMSIIFSNEVNETFPKIILTLKEIVEEDVNWRKRK